MAENSYVFYYYQDGGKKKVELRLVNVSTGEVTTTWTVSTIGHDDITLSNFEVRGAAYDTSSNILYTLVKYYESGSGGIDIIHYRLAKTTGFAPATTNIVLDSTGYVDMNTGGYSNIVLYNLTIIPSTNTLLSGSTNGAIIQLNSDGSIGPVIESDQNNDQGTFVAISSTLLYGVYNSVNNDYIHNYTDNLTNSIANLTFPITSVAYNFLDSKIYYYNANTQLSFTNGTVANTETVGDTLNTQDNSKTYLNPILFFGPTACIHSSSKVLLSDGSYKLITNVTSGDQVYSPDCKTAVVKEVVPCWLKVPNNPFHKCVVFEKDSLAPNVPSELFIIDPGHPMSFATNYDNNGLMSAKEYVNGKTIYMSDYNDVKEMFPEDMKHNRYDIVLNRGDTYVANNVIVKSRTSFKTAGYDLEVD